MSPATLIDDAGPGVGAFAEALRDVLGFRLVTRADAPAGPLLLHGWRPGYEQIAREHPGSWTVWHSGWLGSDLMDECGALADLLAVAGAGHVGVLWLEGRDVLPLLPQVVRLSPLWSPPGPPPAGERASQVVAVGLHGPRCAPAKNLLGSLAAVMAAGGVPLMSRAVASPERQGRRYRDRARVAAWLHGGNAVVVDWLDRPEARAMLARVELLVLASASETWPQQAVEAVYCGTPVLLSPAVAWAAALPPEVARACVVEPKDTQAMRALIAGLLGSAALRAEVAASQRAVLDRLAPGMARSACETLQAAGFACDLRAWD